MNKLIIFFFLLFFNNLFAQNSLRTINNQYFILGTIDEYMGRRLTSSIKDQVDYYYSYEAPLAKYIDSLLVSNKMNPILITEENRLFIFSQSAAKKINSFYNFEERGTSSVDEKGKTWAKEYRGNLKDSIFHDSTEIYSFLLGAYVRYGKKLDTIYKIHTANASSKVSICLQLLKDIGCSDVSFKYLQNIPAQFIVYFNPTKKFEKYIENIEPLKIDLSNSEEAFYKKAFGEDYNKIKKSK